MKVLIVDTIHPILEELLDKSGFECHNLSKADDAKISTELETAEGLVLRSRFRVDAEMMDKAPNLRFIGRVGAGLEHIDREAAKARGIEVLSSPEGNRQAVAEQALGMLLALFNHLPIADREVRKGEWLRKKNEGEELEGKTVAIIGYGNTGSAFGKVISGFDIERLAFDKYKEGYGNTWVREASMEEVYDQADVVSLHLPMNAETRMLVSKAWIDRFRKPFYLINTSRGKIVNTADVLDALDDGRMMGACLDVLEFETENLKMPALGDLPSSAERLARHPQVILTPHTAGLTKQSYQKLSSILAHKIIERFRPA